MLQNKNDHFALIAAIALLFCNSGATAESNTLKHHSVGLFLGAADERGGGEDFTWGLEYEYLINRSFGVGAVYENTDNAHDGDGVEVALAAVYYHPYAGWRLGTGIGREKVHGSHGGYETLYRVGVNYDFHVGRFGIAPTLDLDRVDGENILIYGVAFVYGF